MRAGVQDGTNLGEIRGRGRRYRGVRPACSGGTARYAESRGGHVRRGGRAWRVAVGPSPAHGRSAGLQSLGWWRRVRRDRRKPGDRVRCPLAGRRRLCGAHRISRGSMWVTTPCCSLTGGDSDGTAAGSGQSIRILAVLRSRYLSTRRTGNYPQGPG
jgi:hypothetical protein